MDSLLSWLWHWPVWSSWLAFHGPLDIDLCGVQYVMIVSINKTMSYSSCKSGLGHRPNSSYLKVITAVRLLCTNHASMTPSARPSLHIQPKPCQSVQAEVAQLNGTRFI